MTESDSDPGREPEYHPGSWGGILGFSLLLSASSPIALAVIAGAALLLAFLCALFENALHDYSRVRLTLLSKQRGSDADLDRVLLEEDDILFASKLGRGMFQIVAVAAIVFWLVEAAPVGVAAVGWAVGTLALFLLVGVSGPYVLGRRYGDAILLHWLIPYSRALALLRPVARLFQRIAERLTGGSGPTDPAEETMDDIMSAVEEGTREGTLEHSEKRMIQGVFDLRDVTAEHVMTPRTEMICLPEDVTVEAAIESSRGRGLSRLPVYRETPDEIVGVLYVKDLLPFLGKGETPPIRELLREPFFVPESKNVSDLLQEMRAKRIHLAIVLDEYGGTSGVVSIEDILEEIVGEIADEHEVEPVREMVKISDDSATVDGRTHIDDLNRTLELDVPESEEYETVGGLLFSRMGRVPAAGEHVDLTGVRFTILQADERRIQRVKVTVQRDG